MVNSLAQPHRTDAQTSGVTWIKISCDSRVIPGMVDRKVQNFAYQNIRLAGIIPP
jgi:hypothetical protein